MTVGGIAVVTNGVAAGFPQSVTTPLGSTLTITGFNATTGVVSYSYTLVDNEAHPTANGANNLPEQFAITVVIPHFSGTHEYYYWKDGGVVGGGRAFSGLGLVAVWRWRRFIWTPRPS